MLETGANMAFRLVKQNIHMGELKLKLEKNRASDPTLTA